jgi:hypothetical protein
VHNLQVIEYTRPLIVMRFPAVVDAHVLRAMMDAFDRAHRRGARFATVLDATDTRRLPGPKERQLLADWLGDAGRKERERELDVGSAVVVPSGVVRAFVAAVYFVRTPASPQHWTACIGDAIEWSCARLLEAGIALNPEIERLLEEARGATHRSGTPQ